MNLGWSMYEGAQCYAQPCDPAGKTMPQFEKSHRDGWCSIIAGQTYRGTCYPDIVGTHYLTDYCAHELVAVTYARGTGQPHLRRSTTSTAAARTTECRRHRRACTPIRAASSG